MSGTVYLSLPLQHRAPVLSLPGAINSDLLNWRDTGDKPCEQPAFPYGTYFSPLFLLLINSVLGHSQAEQGGAAAFLGHWAFEVILGGQSLSAKSPELERTNVNPETPSTSGSPHPKARILWVRKRNLRESNDFYLL